MTVKKVLYHYEVMLHYHYDLHWTLIDTLLCLIAA